MEWNNIYFLTQPHLLRGPCLCGRHKFSGIRQKWVRGRKKHCQPSKETKPQTSDPTKIFVETASRLCILEIPQETLFLKCFGLTPRQRLDPPKSCAKSARSLGKSSGAFGVTFMFSSMVAGPDIWHISAFPFVYKCLVKWLLWNRHSSRMDLARQYPEVILSYIYVLFDGTW